MLNFWKYVLLFISIFIININNSFSYENEEIIESINDINISNNININIEKNLQIDLSEEINNLREKYDKTSFKVNWQINWSKNIVTKDVYNKIFESFWDKILNVTFFINWTEYVNKEINIFVYKNSSNMIFQNNINRNILDNHIISTKKSGLYVNLIWPIDLEVLNNINLYSKINDFKTTTDYISIWWEKDFIFDIISKLNKENLRENFKNKQNIIILTSFNIDILWSYAKNFLSNNLWIEKIIIAPEDSRDTIVKSNTIEWFEEELTKNEFKFLNVQIENQDIDNIYFISNFVNNLTSKWFDTTNVYMILIIPILFAIISFFKHFIWLSPTWIVIPVILTLIIFKIWLLVSIVLFTFYIIFNIWLWKLINRYTLLYTPKVSFLITINIIFFIFLINMIIKYNLLPIDLNDSLYFILFIIITERLLTIILSKDFGEYKWSLFNTIFISLLSYFILSYSTIKIFLLWYPEVILFIIPITFIMWRFTWLRVTEYFRFKEVIKNIEE